MPLSLTLIRENFIKTHENVPTERSVEHSQTINEILIVNTNLFHKGMVDIAGILRGVLVVLHEGLGLHYHTSRHLMLTHYH